MSSAKKCQAKGGPANCDNPNCPEKTSSWEIPQFFIEQAKAHTPPKIPFGAWTKEDTVLFKTPTGSRLYNLANANSDDDYYVITPSKYVSGQSRRSAIKQSLKGDLDTVFMDFRSFVKLCSEGAPTTLEVMFSQASKSDFFEDYRNNYYCSDPAVVHKYMATIKRFSLETSDKQFKMRRHALRLALNLEEILYTGRFNPTLSSSTATRITRIAEKPDLEYFKELKKISLIEVDWDESFKKENNL